MKKSLGRATVWTAISTLIKICAGLAVIKWIALEFGSAGIGQAANYMTLLTVLGVFAGAGIFNGVTKYVAQYQDQPSELAEILNTATFIILFFSLFLAVIGWLFAGPMASFIFASEDYRGIIRILAVLQCAIAFGNYFLSVLKGNRDAAGTALSVIGGTLIGLSLFIVLSILWQYQGVLIGLALIPAAVLLPAYIRLKKCGRNSGRFLIPRWHPQQAKKLLPFALMVFSTAVTVPLAYMLIRNRLADSYNINEVGLWQGVGKISDAYLQFVTAAFSVYLLPTFARLNHRTHIVKEVLAALKLIFPLTAMIGLLIYLSRGLIIELLFSADFVRMETLFLWQLIGDLFKVSAYIFGYLVVAKAALRLYVIGELLQCALLLVLAEYFIPHGGALGAVQSYMWSYMIYFGLCLLAFGFYSGRVK